MKRTLLILVCLCLGMSGLLLGQTASATTNNDPADVAAQIEQLKTMLVQQQQQIEALRQQVARQQNAATNTPQAPNLGEVASTTPMVPAGNTTTEASLPANLGQADKPQSSAPASDSIVLAQGKLKIGAVAYGDWGIYPGTGFGPQFVTQTYSPGPGNDDWNTFEITRTYLNFLFIPNKHLTIRITPNLYREIGTPGTNGNLNLRMKYAYAELGNIFGGAAKDDNIRLGQQMNPLVDWEEGLYGYRFVNLTPWNFISLSSTQAGVSVNGPIKASNGKQYLDYQLGVFNNASFHAIENSEGKQFMARASFYPMGAKSKYQGLGLTGFFDVGTSNTLPGAADYLQYRFAAIGAYTTASNSASLAFEYDRGRNAISSGNLFSTGTRPSGAYVDFNNLAVFLLDKNLLADTTQQGFDVFGHVNLGSPKWALFGTFQRFQPNTAVANNPLDFDHVVGGIAFVASKNLRFALDSQNILWRNGQATFSAAQASQYLPTTTGYNNVIGKDINGFFINMELSF